MQEGVHLRQGMAMSRPRASENLSRQFDVIAHRPSPIAHRPSPIAHRPSNLSGACAQVNSELAPGRVHFNPRVIPRSPKSDFSHAK